VPLVMPEAKKQEAIDRVDAYVTRAMPEKPAQLINSTVKEVLGGSQKTKVSLLVIGIALTVWSASGGMAATMSALDTAYDVPNRRPFYLQRIMAVVLTVVVASLVIALLVLVPIGSLAVALVREYGEKWAVYIHLDPEWIAPITWTWDAVRFSLAFVLMFGVLAVVYHFGPNRKRRFRVLTPGSVFSVVVWVLLGLTFRAYIDRFGKYEKTYGTVGGVAILLLFFYIDALVLLIGAEIDSEFDAQTEAMKPGDGVPVPKPA
jgi:membrane protein